MISHPYLPVKYLVIKSELDDKIKENAAISEEQSKV